MISWEVINDNPYIRIRIYDKININITLLINKCVTTENHNIKMSCFGKINDNKPNTYDIMLQFDCGKNYLWPRDSLTVNMEYA